MTTTQAAVKWELKGEGIGSCSCDWGCPCNFDANPSRGWCEGGYTVRINDGKAGDVKLDGLVLGLYAHSPQAIHMGNVTSLLVIDEKATPEQRMALEPILKGEAGGPFAVFASVSTKVIGPVFHKARWKFDKHNAEASFDGLMDVKVGLIKNPVTGDESGFTLKMSNGLLTDEAELLMNKQFHVDHAELHYKYDGQYGETFKFKWSGGD